MAAATAVVLVHDRDVPVAELAALKRAEVQLAITTAIAAAPPAQRQQLADALTSANSAAATVQPDWLTSIGRGLMAAGQSAASAVGDFPWWIVAIAIWLGSRGRRA